MFGFSMTVLRIICGIWKRPIREHNNDPVSFQHSDIDSIFLHWVLLVNSSTYRRDPWREWVVLVLFFCTWMNLSPDSCLRSYRVWLPPPLPSGAHPSPAPKPQGSTLPLGPLGFELLLLTFTGPLRLPIPRGWRPSRQFRCPLPTALSWTSCCRSPFTTRLQASPGGRGPCTEKPPTAKNCLAPALP